MVECGGLENRFTGISCNVGSNPTLSARMFEYPNVTARRRFFSATGVILADSIFFLAFNMAIIALACASVYLVYSRTAHVVRREIRQRIGKANE